MLNGLFRSARRTGLLTVALLAVWPAAARADDLYADLDRDGIRDLIRIHRSGLLVHLSASGSLHHLKTREAITRVAAADVDRDGRLELVAADRAAALHIWRLGVRGIFKRFHARPHRPVARCDTHRSVGGGPADDTTAILTASVSGAPFTLLQGFLAAAPSSVGRIVPLAARLPHSSVVRRSLTRGPPPSA